MRPKTSDKWKNARCRAERLQELNEVCRGLEIEAWEQQHVITHVGHDEALHRLLDTDVARKYRDKARANAPAQKL